MLRVSHKVHEAKFRSSKTTSFSLKVPTNNVHKVFSLNIFYASEDNVRYLKLFQFSNYDDWPWRTKEIETAHEHHDVFTNTKNFNKTYIRRDTNILLTGIFKLKFKSVLNRLYVLFHTH